MSDIQETDIEDVNERTAYYRQNGIINGGQHNPEFPFKKIYDDVFATIKPYLMKNNDARSIGTVLICAALDNITMSMAANGDDKEYDQEKDMNSFMEMLMGMISYMEPAIGTNAALASHNKSIYNTDETEEEKPHLNS